ncbi:ABC transporter substrate-binding protein [Mangrovihabitans endophyticus]|uniref:Amino acid ABC transporter substrate-binding protein n=1 Tax=Mangrovihabitans endophyticus TaxID=1751298 RepID=A0A8J3FPF8_9ACTN|nr:ABC transporter substrate-binding protein [Mangrovihabitans endophyticus]GGK92655.1 amino acid ABC transporter substrate-binding protein [Mangrovihabitans endophyticus]
MRFTRRITASLAASTLISATLAGCTSDDAAEATELVIGADLASGSSVDNSYARALQLRVEQINASGQLGNRRLVLRIQENRSDSTTSLRNISTFADDPNVVGVITGACGECAAGAAKTINDKHIPTIALAAASEVSNPVAERRYLFKLGPNAPDSAATMVNELTRTKTASAAVLYTDDLYGHDAFSSVRSELDKAGVKLKTSTMVKPNATDITQAVGTLTDSEPQALIVLTGSDQATLAAISAKADDYKGKVYFDAEAAADLFVPEDAADATNNAIMVFTQILAIDDVIATTPAKAARKQWFRDYTSRYGSYSGVAAFAADAVDLIANAAARVGNDRDRIRDLIETSQMDGLTGAIRLTPDNHSGLMPQALTLLVARSGRWRIAGG